MNLCREIQPLLALRSTDLSVVEQQQVGRHLATCAACAALIQDYATQDHLLRQASNVRLTPLQHSHLFSQIQHERRRQTMFTKLSLVVSSIVAVAIFTALGLGTQNLMVVDRPAVEELSAQSADSGAESSVVAVITPTPDATATVEKMATVATTSGMRWPVEGHITQTYSDMHPALDIAAPEGASVYAAAEGVVIAAEWDNTGYGNIVRIDHGDGLQTLYTKLSDDLVAVGDKVMAGQKIASVGSTGRATGPHLHFEVIKNEQPVNPLLWLDDGQVSKLLLLWPIEGRITQTYSDQHQALDIAAPTGDPVVAIAAGMVMSAGWDEVYGYNVVIDHTYGLQSRYTKLSAYSVEPGVLVSRGQVIGSVGSTGTSTGPHLHFELMQNGEKINPLEFLE